MKPDGPVFDRQWATECEVVPMARHEVDWMIRRHYIGKWPGVCVCTLGLRHKKAGVVGAIVFALPPRETSVRYGGETWELARLWISDDVPANAETWLIAKAVKFIKKFYPAVAVLVSYADPSAGHAGTIYKAANWKQDGRTDDERKTPRFDYGDARTGQKYSRRNHVPADAEIVRIPRVSKSRFYLRLKGKPA